METNSMIEWRSYEHHYSPKNKDWYWMLGIIALGGSILAFYFDNYLFGIFILVGALALGLISARKPAEITVRITNRGIIFGKYEYPYKNYRSFWVEDDHLHGARILLHPLGNLLPLVSIHVSEEIDLEYLRDVLNDYLDEEFLRESAIHRLFDRLGI